MSFMSCMASLVMDAFAVASSLTSAPAGRAFTERSAAPRSIANSTLLSPSAQSTFQPVGTSMVKTGLSLGNPTVSARSEAVRPTGKRRRNMSERRRVGLNIRMHRPKERAMKENRPRMHFSSGDLIQHISIVTLP